MNTDCPSCGKSYDIDHKYIGRQIKCPGCESSFEVVNRNLIPCPDCFAPISKDGACADCEKAGAFFQYLLKARCCEYCVSCVPGSILHRPGDPTMLNFPEKCSACFCRPRPALQDSCCLKLLRPGYGAAENSGLQYNRP